MTNTSSPHRLQKSSVLEDHPGLSRINLQQPIPWGMGLIGLLKWLVWTPDAIVGKRRDQLLRGILEQVMGDPHIPEQEIESLLTLLDRAYQQEITDSRAKNAYDPVVSQHFLHPVEATRRIRYFSEDFLNKEFDIFCALLPSSLLTQYFQNHFASPHGGEWFVFGNSNDLEYSTNMRFMQIDTLAYNPEHRTLVAMELKIDAEVGLQQVMKYAMMVAYLEHTGQLLPQTRLKLLFIGASVPVQSEWERFRQQASQQLAQKEYPKRGLPATTAATLHERTEQILQELELCFTSWQKLGEFFALALTNIPDTGTNASCYKLIDGFLVSLQEKYSRKQRGVLYQPVVQQDVTPHDNPIESSSTSALDQPAAPPQDVSFSPHLPQQPAEKIPFTHSGPVPSGSSAWFTPGIAFVLGVVCTMSLFLLYALLARS